MTGKKRDRRIKDQRAPARPTSGAGFAQRRPGVLPRRPIVILVLVVLCIMGAALGLWKTSKRPGRSVDAPAVLASVGANVYVGRAVCANCHAREDRLWRGSHHDLAMQVANGATVLGDFDGTAFAHKGVVSRFHKRDGKFVVNTDGPDGKLADYEIRYTFGVWPLQQYLVGFPGGRLQALPIAWDARSRAEGGQRWFHLAPEAQIDHANPLHWTGRYQNWNSQCAECHSTHVSKGYDAATDSYKTTFNELNVACEACHGPGSRHVAWAARAKPPYSAGDDKGVAVVLRSDWRDAWKFPAAGARYARRGQPADPALMAVCAACHARRETLTEDTTPGAPLADSHRLALLTPPLYHADGQQRDEVYVWGSFLQSRMYQQGVTCMDCHDAHTAKLRSEGNALCSRCHAAAVFDSPEHHFHAPGTPGAQCVSCHMPAQDYMVIDARRDHAIRVPRPDLSETLASPNACTGCHADKTHAWAADAMDAWHGKAWRERPAYGTTLHAGLTQGAKATSALLQLAGDPLTPAIVRATAAALLQPNMRPSLLSSADRLLQDSDADVRIAALSLIEPADAAARMQAVTPMLEDPVRGVRMEAARVLADIPDGQLTAHARTARATAMGEYVASLRQQADTPTGNVNFGDLRLRQGNPGDAIAAYERALAQDAQFGRAYVNLADAYRMQGNDAQGEAILRRGASIVPRDADVHYALGLLLVRKGEKDAATRELERATRLAPSNAHYAYAHALALHAIGQPAKAIEALREADTRHPNTPEILAGLATLLRDAGNTPAALPYARKLLEAMPDDPAARQLVSQMEGAR